MAGSLSFSSLISALFIAGTTQAAQVNFTGTVTSQTCEFTGFEGDSLNVPLPAVSQGELLAVGNVAGQTNFDINLTACTTNDDVYIKFGTANADSAFAGTLKNTETTDAATNVNIQLVKVLTSGNQDVNLLSQTDTDKKTVQSNSTDLTFNYIAQYYATGAAKAGLVASNATMEITYP